MSPLGSVSFEKNQITEIEHSVNSPYYAAIDLGSNSFHLAIAEYDGNTFRVIGRLKEKVQLAKGLDDNDILSQEAISRGLDCIRLFAERIKDIPISQIKAVATYTLRTARNSQEFVQQARQYINCPIDILPGKEEARLIYDGVSHNHPDIEKALVIDIGGGSTEVILGEKFDPIQLDSLSMGCVTFNKFFKDGVINEMYFAQAVAHAAIEISPVEKKYITGNWQHCLGSSGSIEAVYQVLQGFGYDEGFVTFDHLKLLKSKLIEIGNIENIALEGLSLSRQNTFTAGLAILYSLFQELKIDKMYIASASLREGILLELAEELKGNDIRHQTADSLMTRLNVDQQYVTQVLKNAHHIFEQVADLWGIDDPIFKNYLTLACKLHEIGLGISFARMRYHSAYVVQNADMPGFSQQTKDSLSAIITNQRKKIYLELFENKYDDACGLLATTQVLRLAILFSIKRNELDISPINFIAEKNNKLTLNIPNQWQNDHQLILTELEKEKGYLNYHNIDFDWDFV